MKVKTIMQIQSCRSSPLKLQELTRRRITAQVFVRARLETRRTSHVAADYCRHESSFQRHHGEGKVESGIYSSDPLRTIDRTKVQK